MFVDEPAQEGQHKTKFTGLPTSERTGTQKRFQASFKVVGVFGSVRAASPHLIHPEDLRWRAFKLPVPVPVGVGFYRGLYTGLNLHEGNTNLTARARP